MIINTAIFTVFFCESEFGEVFPSLVVFFNLSVFLKIYFKNFAHAYVCLYVGLCTCVVSSETRRGITGGCELPCVSSGDLTWILCKSSLHTWLLSRLWAPQCCAVFIAVLRLPCLGVFLDVVWISPLWFFSAGLLLVHRKAALFL